MLDRLGRPLILGALAFLDALAVTGLWPGFGQLDHRIQHPREWATEIGIDAAALEVTEFGLWLAAIWLGVGLAATALSAIPGRVGALGRVVSRRTLPEFLRRLVVGSLGVGLVFGPGFSGVALASAPTAAATAVVTSPVDVGWPSSDRDVPTLDIPTPSSAPAAARVTPPDPAPPTRADPPHPATRGQEDGRVTVRAGDSLWLIAARRLDPSASTEQIAASWPSWYRVNADVIGADPSLLKPGQVLAVPDVKGSPA